MKVVINKCFGGFGLSHAAIMRYAELSGFELYFEEDKFSFTHYYTSLDKNDDSYFSLYDMKRDDPILAQVVEELGAAANGPYADLKVVEVPEDVKWYIDEYDGIENIHEEHRSWG